MIPPFNEHGYLPPGVHLATMEEIEERFARTSEIRRAQVESLKWLIDLARRAGALRLIINGSFVTAVIEPNDVDCVLLVDDSFDEQSQAGKALIGGVAFIGLEIAPQLVFDQFVGKLFASDRRQRNKGMIEVQLWN